MPVSRPYSRPNNAPAARAVTSGIGCPAARSSATAPTIPNTIVTNTVTKPFKASDIGPPLLQVHSPGPAVPDHQKLELTLKKRAMFESLNRPLLLLALLFIVLALGLDLGS